MNREILYLNRSDTEQAGGNHSQTHVDALTEALAARVHNDFVQPLKPCLRQDPENGHIADRIIAVPSHVGGEHAISGIKWMGSKHDNSSKRNMERASGVIISNDPETNYPVAIIEASLISSMHTAAVSATAVKHLAKKGFKGLTITGCGPIGDKQLQSMLEQFDRIERVFVYDQFSEVCARSVDRWQQQRPETNFIATENAKEAVSNGEVAITCTVADQPYTEYDWLQKGAFVSNISIMDIHKEVFIKADEAIVDDWSQCNREKKTINQSVLEGKFSKEAPHVELGRLVTDDTPGYEDDDEIIPLNLMGTAIEDISSAYFTYQQAQQQNIGIILNLY